MWKIKNIILLAEPRVLRIATKQVPVPSQPEVVLSDGKFISLFRKKVNLSPMHANQRNKYSHILSRDIFLIIYFHVNNSNNK